LHEYGYPALFAGLFLESFGSPAPGESLLISAAILAGKGDMSLALVMSIAWSAAVLGDNVGYAIGRFGGRRLVLRFGPHLALRR
jgi:membrane protein DedA with SNARE-associated domain